MRLSIDVGGTFTDILLTSSGGRAEAFKASTTYPDPIEGIVAGLELAAKNCWVGPKACSIRRRAPSMLS